MSLTRSPRCLTSTPRLWAVKNEEHRKARDFVYGTWARLKTFDDVRAHLPRAKEAFDVCKAAGDRLTPQKLALAANAAADILLKTVEELEKSMVEEDKITLKQVQKVSQDLQTFLKDLNTFVRPEEKK